MIINQVRGKTCCNPGSIDHVKFQIDTLRQYQIPAYFSLRYDALTDLEYQSYFQQQMATNPLVKVGGLLEVTPDWAAAAHVEYQGSVSTWHEAQHSLLIGYSPEERNRLIATYMAQFHQVFGQYPELTTAWMIDTPSAYALHDHYGVKIHQITREQWALDSYTLSGGPPHFPYPASRNWAFVPDYEEQNPLIIVRQTVVDPVYVYGDQTSAFTSQPNDYTLDGKNTAYFQQLLTQAWWASPQAGWSVLGLENSMSLAHQQEFARQLALLNQPQQLAPPDQQNVLSPIYIDSKSIITVVNEYESTIYAGRDQITNNNQQVAWITTPTYRIRLRQANQRVFIDDIRIFNAKITDPYAHQPAFSHGYWISPYVLDGSLWYQPNWWSRLISGLTNYQSPPWPRVAQPDLESQPSRLELPALSEANWHITRGTEGIFTLTYLTQPGHTISLTFHPDQVIWTGVQPADLTYTGYLPSDSPITYAPTRAGFDLYWQVNQQPAWGVKSSCQQSPDVCRWQFFLKPELFATAQEQQYQYLFPETRPRPVSSRSTTSIAHNRFAIAGRNPIRVVISPRDTSGFPTTLTTRPQITTQPAIDSISQQQKELSNSLEFYDLSHSSPQKTVVTISGDNVPTTHTTVFFAPNCATNPLTCLTHPQHAWWYLQTLLRDRL